LPTEYFSEITVKNIYEFYPQDGGESQLALKLRRYHPMYDNSWLKKLT